MNQFSHRYSNEYNVTMALDFDVSLLVILGGGRTILLKHITRQPSKEKETLVRLSQGSKQETKLNTWFTHINSLTTFTTY